MKTGEKAELTCKAASAYGDTGHLPKIPGGATLLFEVDLISFELSFEHHLEQQQRQQERDNRLRNTSNVSTPDVPEDVTTHENTTGSMKPLQAVRDNVTVIEASNSTSARSASLDNGSSTNNFDLIGVAAMVKTLLNVDKEAQSIEPVNQKNPAVNPLLDEMLQMAPAARASTIARMSPAKKAALVPRMSPANMVLFLSGMLPGDRAATVAVLTSHDHVSSHEQISDITPDANQSSTVYLFGFVVPICLACLFFYHKRKQHSNAQVVNVHTALGGLRQ